ncbi:unnamed protein product, partial [Brassica oleracea var. botrytis]
GLGLKNLGNTYFLNSVSQFLTYTECLDAYFLDVGNVKSFHVTGFCALCAMQRHVRTALQAHGRIAAPSLKLWRYTFVIFCKINTISALAGSSLRNERSHISCHCQKSRNDESNVKQETSAVDYTAGDMIFFYRDSPYLQGSICSRRE